MKLRSQHEFPENKCLTQANFMFFIVMIARLVNWRNEAGIHIGLAGNRRQYECVLSGRSVILGRSFLQFASGFYP